ncbi:MAG TPA: HNH endonuclease signature motif containing protein, partial [Candidatus Hydrogenedentes bacterium]|nr:HNH endonuclease signature motif containing protein [Candidatus Hydrogenedentota bacterium]
MGTTSESIEYAGRIFRRYPSSKSQSRRDYFWARHGAEKGLHRAIWADANGPIPAGFVIHHVDGDTSNNSIENLSAVPGGAHAPPLGDVGHQIGLHQPAVAPVLGVPIIVILVVQPPEQGPRHALVQPKQGELGDAKPALEGLNVRGRVGPLDMPGAQLVDAEGEVPAPCHPVAHPGPHGRRIAGVLAGEHIAVGVQPVRHPAEGCGGLLEPSPVRAVIGEVQFQPFPQPFPDQPLMNRPAHLRVMPEVHPVLVVQIGPVRLVHEGERVYAGVALVRHEVPEDGGNVLRALRRVVRRGAPLLRPGKAQPVGLPARNPRGGAPPGECDPDARLLAEVELAAQRTHLLAVPGERRAVHDRRVRVVVLRLVPVRQHRCAHAGHPQAADAVRQRPPRRLVAAPPPVALGPEMRVPFPAKARHRVPVRLLREGHRDRAARLLRPRSRMQRRPKRQNRYEKTAVKKPAHACSILWVGPYRTDQRRKMPHRVLCPARGKDVWRPTRRRARDGVASLAMTGWTAALRLTEYQRVMASEATPSRSRNASGRHPSY